MQKRITNAIATAQPTVPYSTIAARVNQVISVALQKAVAYNALNYRYTKLAKPRVVGNGAAASTGIGAAQSLLGAAVNAAHDDWEDDEPDD